MHRQGFDLQLTQYDERGWRATFYTTGIEHSPTSATGTGWERTPWASGPHLDATIAGGFQVPSPGGKIDGGSFFGQYSRITR